MHCPRGLKMLLLIRRIVLLFLLFGACAGQPKHEYTLSEILASPLRVRRPLGHPAHPEAGPGGSDYQSHPLPNDRYDCEKTDYLVQEVVKKSVLACFQSIKKSMSIEYLLKLDVQPEFILDVSEEDLKDPKFEFPRCLVQTLPKLPVPREILVMGRQDENKPPECYSARLDIEANQVLGFKLPKGKQALRVDFPLVHPPKTLEELKRTLLAWMLTPLFSTEDPGDIHLKSKYVPSVICQRCFGEKEIIKPSEPLPPLWPAHE